jgi:hypothetical protein
MRTISSYIDKLQDGIYAVGVILKDKGKEVGRLSGRGFECWGLSETGLFCGADCEGIDLNLLTAASKKKLLDSDILVLDTMQIDEAYRGNKSGIKMITRIVKRYYRQCMDDLIVLVHPCPLTWPDKTERNIARKALSNYYAKHLPIKRINKSPYFYFTVDNQTAL